METRKRNKREREIEDTYSYSHVTALEQCYGRFSEAKRYAFENCRNLHAMLDCADLWRYEYRIISHNGFNFTYGGYYHKVNEETGVVEVWFLYCSSKNSQTWKVCDL